VEVGSTADPLQVTAAVELRGHGDHVDGLTAPEQVDDGVVDRLVRRPVEVDPPEDLGDVGDGVLRDQHRAEHGLLGRHVLRRGAVGRTARRLARLVGCRTVAPPVTRG
jgi:hypothetical protein